MFEAERVYNQRNPTTGITEWFFLAREGYFGPYVSKEAAQNQLAAFISYCVKNGDDGGRKTGKNAPRLSTDSSFARTFSSDFIFDVEMTLRLEPPAEFSHKRREYRDRE